MTTLSPCAMPAVEREERQLVDERGHLLGADRRRDELGGLDLEVADRLASGGAPVEDGDPRAHALEDGEEARCASDSARRRAGAASSRPGASPPG